MQKKRVTSERDRAEALRAEQRAAAHEMKAELERMEQKVTELEHRKGTLVNQAAQAKAGGSADGLGQKRVGGSAFAEFRRMEDQIEAVETTVQAQRELEAGAVRRDERHRHHVEEHEEQQRTPIATGERDRTHDDEPVDQHAPGEQRAGALGCETAHELDARGEQHRDEREPDQPAREVTGDRRDHQERGDDEQPDALEHEEPVTGR